MRAVGGQRGAAALEFALVVPILVLLAVGTIEFGRAYSVQERLSAAAREGARAMALSTTTSGPTSARAAVKAVTNTATSSLGVTDAQITVAPTICAAGTDATVKIVYPMKYLTGMFGKTITLSGEAAMRCGG